MKLDVIFQKLTAHPEIRTKKRIAEICGISPPALNSWKRIPSDHCVCLELASEAAVTRYQMRPDVFGPEPNNGKDASVE